MPTLAYFSLSKFVNLISRAFQENASDGPSKIQSSEFEGDQESTPRARAQVSVNDLKIISSALLHYKKFLNKRKDFAKADTVAEVDDRIYKLILNLEKEKEVAVGQEALVS